MHSGGNILLKKVLPFYRDNLFNRLILSYTALAVVLLGLAGGYMYTQANQMMVREIASDSQSRLISVKDYMEGSLLEKYEADHLNKVLSTIFARNHSNLNYLLKDSWEDNLGRIIIFQKDLVMYKQVLDGVYNLTVYFRTGDYIVDSNSFYTKPDHTSDVDFINGLQNTVYNRWMHRTLSNDKQVMTYVVKLPYETSPEPQGYLFVDVDLDYLNQNTAEIYGSTDDRFYIFDANENLLLQTAEAGSEEMALLQHTIASGESVKEISDHEHGSVVVSYLDSSNSKNSWTYVMIRPVSSFVLASKQLKTNIFVGCSLVLLFGLVVSYMISKRFYIPMKRLIQHIRNLYHPAMSQNQTNEYTIIGNTLHYMGRKIEDLETQAQKNELINLVLGASLGLEHLDTLPRGGRYQLTHIRFIKGDSETFKEQFAALDHQVSYELVCLTAQEAAVIFITHAGEEADEAANLAELERAKQVLGDAFRYGAGMGVPVQSPEEIPISYRSAQQAYRYCFIFGPEAMIAQSAISALKPKSHLFSLDIFQNALKAGKVGEVNRFIDEFVSVLKEHNLQLESVELALLQFVSALYETVIELKLQELVSPSNLFDELRKETLEETVSSIRNLAERIAIHVRDSGNRGRTEVVYKLKTYINEHLQDDLSLNVLSEVASLGPAYVSTLFGEVMNESFTEYVTRTRLEKAADLLRADDKRSVKEIAALVGYRNHQYFHVKFKERFGVTPVQYRQMKLKSGAAE